MFFPCYFCCILSLGLPCVVVVVVGLGCSTVIYPEAAALQAAQILALNDHMIWSRLRAKQLNNYVGLKLADKKIRND